MATLSINPGTTARTEFVIIQQTKTVAVSSEFDFPTITADNSFLGFNAEGTFVNVSAMKKTIWFGFNFTGSTIPGIAASRPAIYASGVLQFTLVGVETSTIPFSLAMGFLDKDDTRFANAIGITPFNSQLLEESSGFQDLTTPQVNMTECITVFGTSAAFKTILYPSYYPIHADKVNLIINNFSANLITGLGPGQASQVMPMTIYLIIRNAFPY
jgi:hypothetical protein